MELLKQYEEVKKIQKDIEKAKDELNKKEDIRYIVNDILGGKEETGATCKETLEVLKVKKYKRETYYFSSPFSRNTPYKFKITKELIKNVEKYLEEN